MLTLLSGLQLAKVLSNENAWCDFNLQNWIWWLKVVCNCTQAKIEFIHGYARFTDDPEPTVEVNGNKYTATHILISTGGHPSTVSEDDVPGGLQFPHYRQCTSFCFSFIAFLSCALASNFLYFLIWVHLLKHFVKSILIQSPFQDPV